MTPEHSTPYEAALAVSTDVAHALDQRMSPPREGDADLLARVRARVLRAMGNESAAPHLTIRAGSGQWESLAPGLERKLLRDADGVVSALLRLAPGVVVAGHAHPIDEECVVLEGTLRIGPDLLLHAGDFHLGRKGRAHADATTDTGAMVYLRSAKAEAEPAHT